MFQAILGALSPLLGTFVETWSLDKETKAKIKQIEAQAAIDAAEAAATAKVERAKSLDEADAMVDKASIEAQSSSWKDEWWTLVLSFIWLAHFVPATAPYMGDGWENLKKAPEWFNWVMPAVIAATFGFRWLARSKLGSK